MNINPFVDKKKKKKKEKKSHPLLLLQQPLQFLKAHLFGCTFAKAIEPTLGHGRK
jgi:hypothetical protein